MWDDKTESLFTVEKSVVGEVVFAAVVANG
jgi:hypothetical protein